MSEQVSFYIKPNWFGFLGNQTHLAPSRISPFREEQAPPSPEEFEEMKKAGIITASGEISPQYLEALQVLASCQSFARVRLTFGQGLFEHINYFSSNKVCGVTTVDEGLKIEFPAQTTKIIEGIKEFIGNSNYQSSDFEAGFPLSQALILGACLDLARRMMLKGLAENQTDIELRFTMKDLGRELSSSNSNAQWFTTVIRGITPRTRQEDLIQSIAGLTSAGYLTSSGQTYRLNGRLELLASRFLIVDKILSLRAGEEIEGEVVQSAFVCLQSGCNDLLMLDTDGETLYLEAVSARKVMDYLQHFLTQPQPLARYEKQAKSKDNKTQVDDGAGSSSGSSISKQTGTTCPYCHTSLPPGAKFCASCGRPLGLKPSSLL